MSDAGLIVDYIISLGEEKIVNDLPTAGKYTFKEHINQNSRGLCPTVSYTDKGGEIIGPLTQQKTLILRSPTMSAVNFDDGLRTQIMNIEPGMIPGLDEELSLIIGEPGSHYVYEDIDFKGINEVNVTIMQHPQYLNGGILEFRMDSLSGDLVKL